MPNTFEMSRYGFNSDGHGKVVLRLRALADKPDYGVPVGINIGKNKDTPLEVAKLDYSIGITHLG